jgi:hypothetical protein
MAHAEPLPVGAAEQTPASSVAATASSATEDRLFDVTLDGLTVGTYRSTLHRQGGRVRAVTEARFGLRLLLVDAFRYELSADEQWQGDCLVALDSRTLEQGRTTTVTGRESGGRFVVDGPRGTATFERCPMSFAYWNPRILVREALVNLQTGVATPIRVHDLGADRVEARGTMRDAHRYRIDTERTSTEVWYAADDGWIALRSTTRSGHVLGYRLK